jgi:hypothetical protein
MSEVTLTPYSSSATMDSTSASEMGHPRARYSVTASVHDRSWSELAPSVVAKFRGSSGDDRTLELDVAMAEKANPEDDVSLQTGEGKVWGTPLETRPFVKISTHDGASELLCSNAGPACLPSLLDRVSRAIEAWWSRPWGAALEEPTPQGLIPPRFGSRDALTVELDEAMEKKGTAKDDVVLDPSCQTGEVHGTIAARCGGAWCSSGV